MSPSRKLSIDRFEDAVEYHNHDRDLMHSPELGTTKEDVRRLFYDRCKEPLKRAIKKIAMEVVKHLAREYILNPQASAKQPH